MKWWKQRNSFSVDIYDITSTITTKIQILASNKKFRNSIKFMEGTLVAVMIYLKETFRCREIFM